MDDRSITAPRWLVVRVCESSRHQRQLLARVYQQVFPQARQSLGSASMALPDSMPLALHIEPPRVLRQEREHVAVQFH
jgi:hypothetical protein